MARGEELRALRRAFVDTTLSIGAVTLLETNGDNATARVSYAFKIPNFFDAKPELRQQWERERLETVHFKRAPSIFNLGEMWQIVPPDAPPSALATEFETPQDASFWNTLAFHLAQQQLPDLSGSPAARSLRNLKQVALASFQLAQDYDEIYAFAPRYTIEALTPYLSQFQSFCRCQTSNEIYAFNGNLSGLKN